MSDLSSNYENFRPITGTVLYRGSDPHKLYGSDFRSLRDMGVRTVIDFRNRKEAKSMKKMPLDEFYAPREVTKPINQSSIDSTQTTHYYVDLTKEIMYGYFSRLPWHQKIVYLILCLCDMFFSTSRSHDFMLGEIIKDKLSSTARSIKQLQQAGKPICSALRLLSRPSICPALLVCSLGKDRTGMMSALVQSVCGISRSTIIKDYTRSEECLKKTFAALRAVLAKYGVDRSRLSSPPENMEEILDFLDKTYGSVAEYLESIGFTREEQDNLRQNVALETK